MIRSDPEFFLTTEMHSLIINKYSKGAWQYCQYRRFVLLSQFTDLPVR